MVRMGLCVRERGGGRGHVVQRWFAWACVVRQVSSWVRVRGVRVKVKVRVSRTLVGWTKYGYVPSIAVG